MLRNWKEQDKLENEISAAEDLLEQTLSRLSRLRRLKRSMRERSDEFVRRGMRGLEEEDATAAADEPMSAEQELAGQAQFSGAFGVVDWESVGLGTSA